VDVLLTSGSVIELGVSAHGAPGSGRDAGFIQAGWAAGFHRPDRGI